MNRLAAVVVPIALASSALSQELLWQTSGQGESLYGSPRFGDLDGDGSVDVLCSCQGLVTGRFTMRILSGANGAVLFDREPLSGIHPWFDGIGDFDGDGYPDFAVTCDEPLLGFSRIQVWSPRRNRELLRIVGPSAPDFGYVCAGDVELDGDGLPDFVVVSPGSWSTGEVRAFDHFGNTLWVLPNTLPGSPASNYQDAMGFSDLDGDGRSELLLGGFDSTRGTGEGFIAVLSGRRGNVLRVNYDPQINDSIGLPLARAGDVDGDGVEDYASGSYWAGFGRDTASVYSGATGALLHLWQATGYALAPSILGGLDVDLDGRPDVIVGSTGYQNTSSSMGRVQAFSSRDEQLLVSTVAPSGSYPGYYGQRLANMGVQPGSPFPVVAVSSWVARQATPGKSLQAWRLSPPGVSVVATGCASSGRVPTIGIRRADGPAGDVARIVLGDAPPGSLAICVADELGATTYSGLQLPIDLSPFGFPSCDLRVAPHLSDVRLVGTAGVDRGYAAIDLPYRLDAGGFGASLQWLMMDLSTGSYATTARLEVHLR